MMLFFIVTWMSELVSEADHVESVCQLYGLVCLAVLFFPRTSRTLTNLLFKLLDNLDNLGNYWWASYVHKFLIASLNWSSTMYREKANQPTNLCSVQSLWFRYMYFSIVIIRICLSFLTCINNRKFVKGVGLSKAFFAYN